MRLLGVLAFVAACDSHPRQMRVRDPFDPPPDAFSDIDESTASLRRLMAESVPTCLGPARPIRSWGRATYEPPPREGFCPIRVRVTEAGVIAEGMTTTDFFERLPQNWFQPDDNKVGTRRILRVDDGWLVTYAGAFDGDVYWISEDGLERRFITRARLAGFVRAPSGAILALGIGQARLGKGGVVALDRVERGVYVPRLVATLPLEPSSVATADDGKLLTFAQGFVVRIDELGKVENLHYVDRDIGKVSSIVASAAGDIFLGLDCGVLRLDAAHDFRESWWSAANGASGQWPACLTAAGLPEGWVTFRPPQPIY